MTEEERKKLEREKAIRFYKEHLRIPVEEPSKPVHEKEDPIWLKFLVVLFMAFILFGMLLMCNHIADESSDVGIETTIRSHGD